jgi:mono/diheme cytochrome c family protein
MSMTLDDRKAGEPVVTVVTDGPVKLVAEVGVASEPRAWHRWKTIFLILLPLLMVLYVCVAARGILGVVEYRPPEAVALARGEPDGAALYAQNCARCHGIGGNADGLASGHLDPPARRFGQEKFMLGTTSTGIPSDDDLVYLMAHGIPGTAMPPFPNLSDDERRAVARHIRRLAFAGLYAKRFQLLAKDEDPDPKEVHEWTGKQLAVGDPLPLPANLTNPAPGAIEHGKAIFQRNCATCHGPEGKGDGKDVKDMKTEYGRPTRPRDLAAGVYKGGGEPDRLFARVSLGMPGTPMPDLRVLPPEDRADLVHFVRSLSGREPGTP